MISLHVLHLQRRGHLSRSGLYMAARAEDRARFRPEPHCGFMSFCVFLSGPNSQPGSLLINSKGSPGGTERQGRAALQFGLLMLASADVRSP